MRWLLVFCFKALESAVGVSVTLLSRRAKTPRDLANANFAFSSKFAFTGDGRSLGALRQPA